MPLAYFARWCKPQVRRSDRRIFSQQYNAGILVVRPSEERYVTVERYLMQVRAIKNIRCQTYAAKQISANGNLHIYYAI